MEYIRNKKSRHRKDITDTLNKYEIKTYLTFSPLTPVNWNLIHKSRRLEIWSTNTDMPLLYNARSQLKTTKGKQLIKLNQ